MDRESFVKELNGDLSTEYQSIVQYIHHIATMKGPEYVGIMEELRNHLNQELTHAMTLAEQIDFLDGVPTTEIPDIDTSKDPQHALEADLSLEQEQLRRYREHVEAAQELGLEDVAEALRPLLTQTQDHVKDLETALEQ